MNTTDHDRIARWLTLQGLTGASELDLLVGFCERCWAAGLQISRGLAIIDTLHPVYEGRAFAWRRDGAVNSPVTEYRSTAGGPEADNWQRTAFYHLLTTDADEVRRRIGFGDPLDFLLLDRMQEEGQTDYFAMVQRFTVDGSIGEMDGLYSHWVSAEPDGFGDDDIAALRRLVPILALAIKCASLARITSTLAEIYLGADAGALVLSGRISRGVAERIAAVLWFSDLRDYTRISENAAPDEIIPLLNDYADAVISSIHEAGGTVLKLMGDGILAIFRSEQPEEACTMALVAERALRARLVGLAERRAVEGRPVTEVYLGLHIGEVFYGNIGSQERLDFTVVGPAVNEVGRIASMCRSTDRALLISEDFAAALPPAQRTALVSVGRYALRGVRRPRELFTLDPDIG
ncbi:MAG TPA: adenylate/guanylate cyclase domain-containing protein [Xanthobacteraceae bacterium]|nr:adenylate/guanylate cyclase domain-containing protein [Xanthobacteraceae bacterium]